MNGRKRLFAVLAMVALLVVVMACGNGDAAAEPEVGEGGTTEQTAPGADSDQGASLRTSGPNSGIWVTGQASVTVEPDLVLLTVGVETTAETVAEARAEAAGAMDAVIRSVKAHGLEDQDAQTQSFHIYPQYEYPEVISGGTRTTKRVLVGYTIMNTARIKIRDVDAVGTIIDDVAEAGGDAARINDIRFSIEDPKPFATQLRDDAVRDAIAKAEHFASLTGVAVGDLVFVGEVGAGALVIPNFEAEVMMSAAATPTPIGGGELQLNMNVRVVFSIK